MFDITNGKLLDVILKGCAVSLVSCALGACGGVANGNSTNTVLPDAGGASGSGGTTSGSTSVVGSGGISSPSTGGSSGGVCQDCLPIDGLQWGMNGGMVVYQETSYLTPCRNYAHQRDYYTSAAPLECTQTLPACPDQTMNRIINALNDSGFTKALQNHTLYGADLRPVDGQVFRIAIGVDYIDVGTPCSASPASCSTMPSAVADLVTVLRALDQTELATDSCKLVFGN